ncbi:MAG TPA: hypothetical protein DFL85_07245 [Lentisphaeria bacterium]|nr:hypothetical protein C5Q97_05320 [Victivallales bacterium CCUG 44730]HBP06413.1 hypothetical protein [Lentisphaeria bacterium]HCH85291.1 hypothetical protein [Lentisphaeria bacterium]
MICCQIFFDNPRKIIVAAGDLMISRKIMYERAGFHETGRRNHSHFSGYLIDDEYQLNAEPCCSTWPPKPKSGKSKGVV